MVLGIYDTEGYQGIGVDILCEFSESGHDRNSPSMKVWFPCSILYIQKGCIEFIMLVHGAMAMLICFFGLENLELRR